MKYEQVHERRQSADHMESTMLLASLGGVIAAAIALNYGWLPSLGLFLLSVIAFGLSRVFDLLSSLIGLVGKIEENQKLSRSVAGDNTGSQVNS